MKLLIVGGAPSSRGGTEDGSEEWGYIPVRPGASMFYWFYRTTHPVGYFNRPLLLWLQGGPGLSGTGFGNFLMFGPLDENLQPRNTTWIQTVNLLIVDNPVDTGFSVVENSSLIPSTVEEISADLITMLIVFFDEHSFFRDIPFYIFGQSYGGKMAAALTYYLHQAISTGDLQCNFRGTGIGNGMVSGPDILVTLAPMLYQMSQIDDVQFGMVNETAWSAYREAEEGNWTAFQTMRNKLLSNVFGLSNFLLNPYNILLVDGSWSIYGRNITELMNGPIREKLGIIPEEKVWDQDWLRIKYSLSDHDQPVWHLVDAVLKSSDIDVVVYQGQLDILCNTAGALRWLSKLTWVGKDGFDKAERKMLNNPFTDVAEMFVKSHCRVQELALPTRVQSSFRSEMLSTNEAVSAELREAEAVHQTRSSRCLQKAAPTTPCIGRELLSFRQV